MAKRSIEDGEIALIKAMLARGMKNKDIQFFFNRPDRPVNSGRITGIRDGTYGRSAAIPAADGATLDSFMAERPSESVSTSRPAPAPTDPLDESAIRSLFTRRDGKWFLTEGETDRHECKTSFGLKSGPWLKAAAALANNKGGYIFFGVREGADGAAGTSLEVTGLASDEFQRIDPVKLTQRLKSVFDPTPTVRRTTLAFDGLLVGVLHVEQHRSRPVIATKQDERIAEGDIFFRYPGQSARIKYSDLRAMLDARDAEARAQILPMVERLLTLGPARTMIADLEKGTIGDGGRTIRIDEDLVSKLTFIKEGEFDEKDGAPTLRLVGDVQPVAAAGTGARIRRGVITRSDLLRDFLDRAVPENPTEYIRFALEASQGEWLPLLYFARLAGLSHKGLVDFVNATSASAERKRTYLSRLAGDAAHHVYGAKPRLLLPDILAGRIAAPEDAVHAGHIGQALQALDRQPIDESAVLGLLKRCLEKAEESGDANRVSPVRRAICRVDEVLHGPLDP